MIRIMQDPRIHCTRGKRGWRCSRDPHHDGPCALWPVGWRKIYWAWRLTR